MKGKPKRSREAVNREVPAKPVRGRPKGTAPDAVPVTLHLSAETYRQARIKRLELNDQRPLSKIVELLLDGWSAGDIELPEA
jgi:hypothetical protein